MSAPSEPAKVKLVIAVTYNNYEYFTSTLDALRDNYGEIDFIGDEYNFDFTHYYADEMGENLKKRIFSFRELIPPETIIEVKWFAYNLEKKFSRNNKRNVNIDPGYLTRDNFLLTTFKNSPHRIYLRNSVYAEIELIFENGEFCDLKWTYPDYRLAVLKRGLVSIRNIYLSQLREIRR